MTISPRTFGLRVLTVSAMILAGHGAAADTLADAFVKAYQSNPTLAAARAELRGLDESVPQALSTRRPQITANASASRTWRDADGRSDTADSTEATLTASLLLYDNGQSKAAIEAARNQIAAGRANLKSVEQSIFYATVEAYADVLRDQEFVRLARSDVERLEETLRATRNRFDVGEVTRTDVSLAEASLASSRSSLAAAEGNLEVSREAYRQVVGNYPDKMQTLPPQPDLPDTIENAMALSYARNPQILAAQFSERVAAYTLQRAIAAGGPSVNLGASTGISKATTATGGFQGEPFARLSISGSVPLYTGGQRSSLIREAEALLEQRRFQVQEAGRTVSERISAAWTRLDAARVTLMARREQAEASRVAAEGVQEEARLGARSTLDVLDANQERLAAEAEVVSSVRDEYVATYAVLQSLGLLTVEHLDLGIQPYEPEVNFRRVQSAPVGGFSTTSSTSVLDRIRDRWSPN